MKYIVTFSYSIDVEADNKGDAETKASEIWDSKTIYAEDMNVKNNRRKNIKDI